MAEDPKTQAPAAPAEGAQNPAPAAPAAPADAKKAKKGGNPLKAFMAGRTPAEKAKMKWTGLVIAIVIVDAIVVRPVSAHLSRLDEAIKVQEQVIPKRLLILRHKDKIIRDYHSWKAFMTDPAITQEEEIARFLREIERVSKEANLFISNINPVKVENKSDTVYDLSVDIEGKGAMDQLRRFMKILESANAAMRIGTFNFKPQSKESEDIKYSFTLIKIGVKEKSLVNISP